MTIEFRKGPTAAVSFRVEPPAKPAEGATNAVPAQVPDEQESAAAMAMMAPMLQGMRVSFLVEVDGKIVRTSAQVREGDNRVVLMDMPLGKVLAHAEGSKLIGGGAQDPEIIQKIQALKIEGVVIEDLEKGLTVEFE